MTVYANNAPLSTPLAIYIHWPFCLSKCPYCDFNSHVREQIDQARWRQALLRELDYFAQHYPNHTVTSVFFGGGTPSLMQPATVAALIDAVAQHWPVDPAIEITLEANPTSVETDRLAEFKTAGVTRISLGVQSLRPESLAFLGREHSAEDALQAVTLAATLFERFSFDLIYALPGQTCAAWEQELRQALQHAGEHLSLYQLTIEPNTAFHYLYHNKHAFQLPEDTLAADVFLLTQELMEEAGLPAYEVSNHAALGQECRHNMAYWTDSAYLGIGPGAHGRTCNGTGWQRTITQKSPERWLEAVEQNNHGLVEYEAIDGQNRLEEMLIVGLRLRDGIVLSESLKAVIDHEFLSHAVNAGLLRYENDRLTATHDGWLVLNHLISKLLK